MWHLLTIRGMIHLKSNSKQKSSEAPCLRPSGLRCRSWRLLSGGRRPCRRRGRRLRAADCSGVLTCKSFCYYSYSHIIFIYKPKDYTDISKLANYDDLYINFGFHQISPHDNSTHLVGDFKPSARNMSSSVGMMTFPTVSG